MNRILLLFLPAFLLSAPALRAEVEIPPPYECSPLGDSPRTTLPPLCLDSGVQNLTDAYCEPLEISEVKESEARDWFRALASHADLPFRFLPDGCQARAQRISELLLAEGIRPGKLFIRGKFGFDNPYDSLWPVRWQFHVAIVLRVQGEKGEGGLRVLDPALFSRPVSVEDFRARFAAFSVSRIDEVYLTGPFTYELNHRPLRLSGFRARDLECGAELLRTTRLLQDQQDRNSR